MWENIAAYQNKFKETVEEKNDKEGDSDSDKEEESQRNENQRKWNPFTAFMR